MRPLRAITPKFGDVGPATASSSTSHPATTARLSSPVPTRSQSGSRAIASTATARSSWLHGNGRPARIERAIERAHAGQDRRNPDRVAEPHEQQVDQRGDGQEQHERHAEDPGGAGRREVAGHRDRERAVARGRPSRRARRERDAACVGQDRTRAHARWSNGHATRRCGRAGPGPSGRGFRASFSRRPVFPCTGRPDGAVRRLSSAMSSSPRSTYFWNSGRNAGSRASACGRGRPAVEVVALVLHDAGVEAVGREAERLAVATGRLDPHLRVARHAARACRAR